MHRELPSISDEMNIVKADRKETELIYNGRTTNPTWLSNSDHRRWVGQGEQVIKTLRESNGLLRTVHSEKTPFKNGTKYFQKNKTWGSLLTMGPHSRKFQWQKKTIPTWQQQRKTENKRRVSLRLWGTWMWRRTLYPAKQLLKNKD